jgi:hypothetical protein
MVTVGARDDTNAAPGLTTAVNATASASRRTSWPQPDSGPQALEKTQCNRTPWRADGSITIAARHADGSIRTEVRDTVREWYRTTSRACSNASTADSSCSRSTGGAGLGVAMVRQFVLALGDRGDVASDGPGRGTTFTIALPLEGWPKEAPVQPER